MARPVRVRDELQPDPHLHVPLLLPHLPLLVPLAPLVARHRHLHRVGPVVVRPLGELLQWGGVLLRHHLLLLPLPIDAISSIPITIPTSTSILVMVVMMLVVVVIVVVVVVIILWTSLTI